MRTFSPPRPGSRVRHRISHRIAMVAGRPEPYRSSHLLPVTLEGTTRTELWPAGLIQILPLEHQPIALGGRFAPPKGYPLNL